jgi:hypothetical protein
MVRANGYSLRVESVRENRVEAVRIREHEGPRRGQEVPRGPHPVEEAASAPPENEPRDASQGA